MPRIQTLTICLVFASLVIRSLVASDAAPMADLILVQGAGGESQYEQAFSQWRQVWQEVAAVVPMNAHVIGLDSGARTDREQLQQAIADLNTESERPLWIVLIGHGTYFREQAKFNLQGPDVAARELKEWLAPVKRPIAIVVCASSSGPFIDRLSAPNRVIVTATRSGSEQNYARFGQYLAEAIQGENADIDHDGAISLLEAFLTAARRTQTFYDDEGRLATEHALLDDNGDHRGTSADFFRGIRVTGESTSEQAVDGLRAHQWMLTRLNEEPPLPAQLQIRRNELESQIEGLRQQKSKMTEAEYYDELEVQLVELARLYAHDEPSAATEAALPIE